MKKIVILFFIFKHCIYPEDKRETEAEVPALLVHFPNAPTAGAGPGQNWKLGAQARSPNRWRGPSDLSHHRLLPQEAGLRSGAEPEPGTLRGDVGLPRGAVTTVPSALP